MKTLIKKSLLVIAAVGVLSMAAASDVSARSFGAALGEPVTGSDTSCFNSLSGIPVNVCGGGARLFEVQLPTDNSGSKTVSFTAASGVSCTAFATNSVNSAFVGSNTILITSGTLSSGTLSAIPLPAGGKLWLQCNINSGGALGTVNYNQ